MFCFSKLCIYDFFFFDFVSLPLISNHMGEKNFKRHHLWKYITDSLPYFKFWIFAIFFFFFVFINMGSSYGRKKLQPTCVKVHNRFAPKHSCIITPRKGLYQSCIKNCEISNFGFGANFFVLFCKRLVVKWNGSTFRRPLV